MTAIVANELTPKEQLDVFIDRFTPEVARMARRALAKLRKLTPAPDEHTSGGAGKMRS